MHVQPRADRIRGVVGDAFAVAVERPHIVSRIEGHGHQTDLIHVRVVEVVDGIAHALRIGEQRRAVHRPDGLGMIEARCGGYEVFVDPTEKRRADLRFVCPPASGWRRSSPP